MNNFKNKADMTFMSHIDELRSRLLKIIFSVILFSSLFYVFSDYALLVLSQPKIELLDKVNLQVLKITSMFMIKLYLSIVGGIMASLPVIMYHMWKFVSPAIDKPISLGTMLMFSMSSFFFIGGAYFSFSIIIPISISFFTSVTSDFVQVQYNITLENYLTYVIWMLLIGGLVFQLPVAAIIFKKLGVIDHNTLINLRRYAILWIFIVSAILTPPDPFSQILFVVPLILLYEASILILRIIK